MPQGDSSFPLRYPGDARPVLATEAHVRRIVRQLQIENGSRVLLIGLADSAVPLVLSRDLGCEVVTSDALEAAGQGEVPKLAFNDGEFHAIFVDARAPFPLETGLKTLRRFLAPRGRLCVSYPVRVGRNLNPPLHRFWEAKLGEPLRLPREGLEAFVRNGYEPQLVEAAEDLALSDFYLHVEQALQRAPSGADSEKLREEIALFRSQGGRSTVSFAVMVGRRREPGEKPLPSRNE